MSFASATQAAEDEWGQWGHDASRAGESSANGPIWPKFVSGWPVVCGGCRGPFAIMSIRGKDDQAFERHGVVFGSTYVGKVYAYDERGRSLPGWPVKVSPPGSTFGNVLGPAVVREQGTTSILISDDGYYNNFPFGFIDSRVHRIDENGVPYPGWPISLGPDGQNRSFISVAKDTDHPGRHRAYAQVRLFGNEPQEGLLHALLPNGQDVEGWPQSLSDGADIYVDSYFNAGAVSKSGKVYSAGTVGSDGKDHRWALYGHEPDGAVSQGWPVALSSERYQIQQSPFIGTGPAVGRDGSVYAAAAGDVDLNPNTFEDVETAYYRLDEDGSVKAGWPVRVNGAPLMGTPAIRSNGDSYLSITEYTDTNQENHALYSYAVYAFDADGNVKPGWPVRFKKTEFPDHIFGIALDAQGNAYFAHENKVYGIKPSGRPLPGWPVNIAGTSCCLHTPALANDGTLYIGGPGKIYAFRSGNPETAIEPQLNQ